MEIKVLPKSLRIQISAEYNISSVVHCITQLVINSLEAKATSIAIRFNLTSNNIQVIDNGIGFTEQNLKIVGARYATSKYQTINDIESNHVLFPSRGIVLPDIISLSKTVKITSRTSSSPKTFCKTFETGNAPKLCVVKQRPSKGTTVTIHCFQFNKPVRNKCINIDVVINEIEKAIKLLAIRNANTSFSLRNDATGSIIFQLPRTNFVYKSIMVLYGNVFKANFRKIVHKHANVSITGLIYLEKHPQNVLQLFYLNRRFINNSNLHKVMHYTLSKSNIGKNDCKQSYYQYVMNIDCPYTAFDVIDFNDLNVVFKDFNGLMKCVVNGLYNFLTQHELVKVNAHEFAYGSPISEPNPAIRVSQVGGIVRGIPTKRKNELISFCENKIPKLMYHGNNELDENKISTALEQKTTNKVVQTSAIAFSSKAIQANSDDFLFKKPLPPKPKLIKSKTEVIHFKINKSDLEVFQSAEHQNKQRNLSKQHLEETCSKLKSRIYQEHLIDQKYCSLLKKLQVKNKFNMRRQTTSFTKEQPQMDNKKTNTNYWDHLFRRYHFDKWNKQKDSLLPIGFDCKKTVSIFNLRKSDRYPPLDYRTNTNYIYTNNSGIVSTKKVLKRRNIHERNKILGVQFLQVLPHLKRQKTKSKTLIEHQKYKRFLSRRSLNNKHNQLNNNCSEFSFMPRTISNCKTQKTFNSHLNMIKNQNDNVNTNFSFKNQIRKDDPSITILEQNLLKQNTLESNKTPQINCDQLIKDNSNFYRLKNYKNIIHWLENINDLSISPKNNVNSQNLNTIKNQNEKINSNFSFENQIRKDDTPITILEQNLLKQNTLESIKTPQINCDQLIKDNSNYKNILHWLENISPKNIANSQNLDFSFMKSCTTPINRLNSTSCITITSKHSIEEIQINVNPFDLINEDETNTPNELNKNIETLLKNMETGEDAAVIMTPIKFKDPVYNSPISTVTPEKIVNETSNSIHLIINNPNISENNVRSEWQKHTTDNGSSYYVNKRTGMTTFLTPKSLEKYSMTTRQTYLPKGMSPILNTSNVQLNELTPNARNLLHQTMANTEVDELQTVKWMNFFQNNESKEFFANLYSDKKHFEIDIAKLNKQCVPKKLLTAFHNYSFTKDHLKDAVVINQFDKKFIVSLIKINGSNLLVMFDQHAVHERICLEKLIKDYEVDDKLKSIKCNKSISVSLENNEIQMLKKYKINFQNWGLFYDILDSKIKINQIPLCWKNKDDCQDLILRLIQEENTWLKNIGKINTALPLIILNTIKTEACRSAIKFGDPLTIEQCSKIIQDLSECVLPFQCAHGRPSLVPILELMDTEFEEGRPLLNNLALKRNK